MARGTARADDTAAVRRRRMAGGARRWPTSSGVLMQCFRCAGHARARLVCDGRLPVLAPSSSASLGVAGGLKDRRCHRPGTDRQKEVE
jgi:hypothetical protein